MDSKEQELARVSWKQFINTSPYTKDISHWFMLRNAILGDCVYKGISSNPGKNSFSNRDRSRFIVETRVYTIHRRLLRLACPVNEMEKSRYKKWIEDVDKYILDPSGNIVLNFKFLYSRLGPMYYPFSLKEDGSYMKTREALDHFFLYLNKVNEKILFGEGTLAPRGGNIKK